MNLGLILKDKENSGFTYMKKLMKSAVIRHCIVSLLLPTSKSDLQDSAMLISHPNVC